MQHSVYSPSSAHRWLRCTQSLTEHQLHEKRDAGTYAQIGTDLHAIAENCLKNNTDDKSVQMYLDYIRTFFDLSDDNGIETQVDFSSAIGRFGAFGTCDAWCVIGEVLHVFDLKTGNTWVKANNEQLKLYAAGLITEHNMSVNLIKLHIVMTAFEKVDTHEMTLSQLSDFLNFVRVTLDKPTRFEPSKDVCKYCNANGSCAGQVSLYSKMVEDKHETQMLIESDNIRAYLEQLQKKATERAVMDGYIPAGFVLTTKRTQRKLLPSITELGEGVYKQTLKGITELERIFSKEEVSKHTTQEEGEQTLKYVGVKNDE